MTAKTRASFERPNWRFDWGRMRAAVVSLALLGAPLAVAAGLVSGPALAQAAGGQAGGEDERHTLNLRDADITAFIEDIGAVTGYTFIIHPLVKGKVTVISPTPLSREDVFEVFLSTLRVNGYTAVPAGAGAYRVIPDNTAAEDAGDLAADRAAGDQFVTEVLQLRYYDAAAAASVVKPLVNGRGQVTANPDSNIIVVVDYASNIGRIKRIIEEMDQDNSVIERVSLYNMPANEVVKMLNDLRNARDTRGQFTAAAVESGNSVLIRGERAVVARIQRVIAEIDQASEPSETLKVIYLKHADAAEIVPVLEQVGASIGFGGEALKIPFHEATNSVILSADPKTVRALERVIGDLDIRRAQVQVEAIIVEISDDTARELGLQFILSGEDGSSTPFAVNNFSRSAPNLLALTGALVTSETSDTSGPIGALQDQAIGSILGIEGFALGVGGQTDDGALFGAILNAVNQDGRSNILSTPLVTTLDNVPAKLSVGQEIPITTGEVLGSANVNPFRTISREEVGVQLEVLPQITEGDTIRLEIRQEVSSVAGPLNNASAELITNKREIETTVVADDGEVIVLGGLIEEAETQQVSKLPILGDIPAAGRLFRSEGSSTTRTNLMVFIRPTIVRDASTMRGVTSRKYDFMRGQVGEDEDGLSPLDAFVRQALGPDALDSVAGQ